MGCGKYWDQIHNIERDLDLLERAGVGPGNPVFDELTRQRGEVFGRLGQVSQRVTIPVFDVLVRPRLGMMGIFGVTGSPEFTAEELENAIIRVWYDIETGWITEGKLTPSRRSVYRRIEFNEALAFMKEEETPEMIAHALGEDEYIGE